MTKKLTFRIWMLLFFVVASFLVIFVSSDGIMAFQKGVIISSVPENSTLYNSGLRNGMVLQSINQNKINNLEEYSLLVSFNGTKKTILKTNELELIALVSQEDFQNITISEIPLTRINTGLDLRGGARALVAAEDKKLTVSEVEDLISVSQERLNVYGLSDIQLRQVSDLSGSNFMLVEIAGSSPEDLESLIAQQGVFEAKIGNDTVFEGGNHDVTHVSRTASEGAMVYDCKNSQEGDICFYRFPISLSPEAAKRHAAITKNLSINISAQGRYLEKKIDFYLDGILTNSLSISADLRGATTTQIQISGSGSGATREEALLNAEEDMKKLQTVLITGSLPFKLEILKLDRISPKLGEGFLDKILYAGLFAILAVFLIVLIRYRKIKVSLALVGVSLCEVLIIMGVAAMIKWNLDLPSIAGIIATIGTGVDSQIVILDEARIQGESLKQKIKKALFIIGTAFATTFVALIPLTGALSFMGIGAVSAGLLKGFAITTLIGITTGILITRPAFADIAEILQAKEE